MHTEDYNKYYNILELEPGATLHEIRNSYRYLKNLYSSDSIVVNTMIHEFPKESKQHILEQIEEAYEKLTNVDEGPMSEPIIIEKTAFELTDELKLYVSEVTSFGGGDFRHIREKLGISVEDLCTYTRIKKQYIHDIEKENFPALPADVYLRGYIVEYAKYLTLEQEKIANEYMAKVKTARNKATAGK